MKRAITIAMIACIAGCGDASGGGTGSATETSGTSSTSNTSSTTSTSDASSTSSGGIETSSSEDESTTATMPDLPPHPTACDEPEALIEPRMLETPEGPMTIDEGWIVSDTCGSGPFVQLVQHGTPERPDGQSVRILMESSQGPVPRLGSFPARVLEDTWEVTGTMEVLDPFMPGDGSPHPDSHFHAQIEIHSGGYDVSVEVDFIDCGGFDCSCPCR